MSTNEFLPFCPTDNGTNLLDEAAYTASADRTSGNKPGVASAKLNNKALRQANGLASQLAQFVSNKSGTDVLDDANYTKLLAQVTSVLTPLAPIVRTYLASGTHNASYVFFIAVGSATAGATYTHNSTTYTVSKTVASGLQLTATGNAAPLTSGTLTKAAGTGDATITFYAVRSALILHIRMVGAGGGGAGGGTAGGSGGNGTATTFGTTFLSAGFGAGSSGGGTGGAGGAATLPGTVTGIALPGGSGTGAGLTLSTGVAGLAGGCGGSSAFGGGGGGDWTGGGAAFSGAANTGGGGGGGGSNVNAAANLRPGSGGGAGGFIDAFISAPLSTYACVVGTGGTAGAGSTSGSPGGAGADGHIEVIELFQ